MFPYKRNLNFTELMQLGEINCMSVNITVIVNNVVTIAIVIVITVFKNLFSHYGYLIYEYV